MVPACRCGAVGPQGCLGRRATRSCIIHDVDLFLPESLILEGLARANPGVVVRCAPLSLLLLMPLAHCKHVEMTSEARCEKLFDRYIDLKLSEDRKALSNT